MHRLGWLLGDLVTRFEFYMWWYFTLPLVIALMLTGGLASFLTRSRKWALLMAMSLLFLFGGYKLCSWTNLDWKLYCYGMYGQFHVPGPYSDDLYGETQMWEDRSQQKVVPAASQQPASVKQADSKDHRNKP